MAGRPTTRRGPSLPGPATWGKLIGHLELETCAVVGLSGGGPTALACGVVLTDRVTAVAIVGGVAPLVPRALFAMIVRAGRTQPEKSLDRFAAMLAESGSRLFRDNAEARDGLLLGDLVLPYGSAIGQ